ncbi:MAG: hypothetical protein V4574_09815 [Pseudomonadota bacterium]
MSNRSILALLCGAAFLLPAAGARAAEPCSMPAPLEQRVCADPELRKLDGELVAKERAVQAATARPATWAARAARFRGWIAAERDGDGNPIGKSELVARFESRIQELDNEVARAAAIRPARTQAAVLGARCLAGWFAMNCTVPASGIVRDGGLTILYQIQSGSSEQDGIGAGVVLWDASKPGAPRLIGWTFEGVEMKMPQLNAERGLLWVPGTMIGTGGHNADILFQKRDDRWVEIDMGSWDDALAARLPKGVAVNHGVDYYLMGESMGAETDLWQDADANCCPTAGRANLGFAIRGDALTLDTVSAQLGGPKEAWKDL